jgi:GNAT superfamily N-acetyltransferase
MATEVDFHIESAASAAAASLMAALDQDLLRRYPGMPVSGIDVPAFEAAGGLFAIGYMGGTPAVCGAFLPYEGAAEIKRMFVVPAFRGRGLGRRMLRFLEEEALRRGFTRGVLETGTQQPEALGLYASAGWRRIPTFGPYVGSPVSTCFDKQLG